MPHSSIRRYLRHGTLPQLSVFEAVARHGSYTRAAEELYMAQPTVSVQIRKLTETIGLPLLEQVGKTVRLTPVGKELLVSCNELFQTLTQFERKVANLRGLQTGSLEIAVCGTAKCFASRLLAGFARNHPDITVRMHVGPRPSLLERITANMDDLYLMADPPANLEAVGLRIGPNPIVVLAHPDHPLAGKRSVPFAEFAKQPLLVREPGSGMRSTMERLFAGHGATPVVRMELGSSEAILEALAAGVGASILPREVVGPDFAARLTELDVDGFPLESHWYLVHPVGKQLSFIAQAFLDLVRAQAPQPESPELPPSMMRCA